MNKENNKKANDANVENLQKFIEGVRIYQNFILAYEAFYLKYAKPYFQRIIFDKSSQKLVYKDLKLAEIQFECSILSKDEWKQMEDHTKIGFVFILAHNWLAVCFEKLYQGNKAWS